VAVGAHDPRNLAEVAGPYQVQRFSRKKWLRVSDRLALRARGVYHFMQYEWHLTKKQSRLVNSAQSTDPFRGKASGFQNLSI
jgi:hypothetical protein